VYFSEHEDEVVSLQTAIRGLVARINFEKLSEFSILNIVILLLLLLFGGGGIDACGLVAVAVVVVVLSWCWCRLVVTFSFMLLVMFHRVVMSCC